MTEFFIGLMIAIFISIGMFLMIAPAFINYDECRNMGFTQKFCTTHFNNI